MCPRRLGELLDERIDAAGESRLHVPPAAAMAGRGDILLPRLGEQRARQWLVPFNA
jgi:hypothetical protein